VSQPSIVDLQTILLDTMRALKNGEMTVEQAKAMADVGQTMVNVAKVEVECWRVTGATRGSGFLPSVDDEPPKALPNGIVGIRRHVLKDD
jgi:hypothetical protein